MIPNHLVVCPRCGRTIADFSSSNGPLPTILYTEACALCTHNQPKPPALPPAPSTT